MTKRKSLYFYIVNENPIPPEMMQNDPPAIELIQWGLTFCIPQIPSSPKWCKILDKNHTYFWPGVFWFKCTPLQWSLAFFKQRAVLHQEMVIKVTCCAACEITALQLSRHIPGNRFYGYIKFQKLQLYSISTENYRQKSTAASSYTLLRMKKTFLFYLTKCL